MEKLLANKNYTFASALILLLAIALYYINYNGYLSFLPWGPHFWRQSDSLAFTMHYYFHNAPFFQPGTYNAECTNGNAVSEFPILYYITSLIWNLTGYQPIILKLINTFILFTGILYLYKSFVLLTKNYWVGIGMCLVLASSTVVLYYTNNFIPDPPAVGFRLIGLYHFLKFTQNTNTKNLAYAFAFFTLASLIKISVFILPFSIVGLFALEKVFKFNFLHQKPLFAGRAAYYIILFSAYFLIVFAWVWWIKQYNAQNTCTLFLTDIKPIWECDAPTRANAWQQLVTKWYKAYYFLPVLLLFALLLVIGVANYRNVSRLGGALIILNVGGSVAYYLLFFYQFIAHDYML